MKKKGQLTLFLIIGILMILVLVLVLYLQSEKKAEPQDVDPTTEIRSLDYLIQTCLQSKTEEALQELGLNGGFITTPPQDVRIILTNNLESPVYFFDNQVLLPPLSFLEKEISTEVANQMRYCFDDFDFFTRIQKKEIDFEKQRITANTSIGNNGITIRLSLPVNITIGSKTTHRQEFITTIPLHLKDIHTEARRILENVAQCKNIEQSYIETAVNSCGSSLQGVSISPDSLDKLAKTVFEAADQQCPESMFVPLSPNVDAFDTYRYDDSILTTTGTQFSQTTVSRQIPTIHPTSTLQTTILYKLPIPFSNCQKHVQTDTESKQNIFFHSLYDPSYQQSEFTFIFTSWMFGEPGNIDFQGICNLC